MTAFATPGGVLCERVLGDFALRELIGSGGFGDVYLAEQLTLRREAVVKVLRSGEAHARRVEGFLREAKLASQLDHPYAAHVYAFGAEPDGVCWIAMELVRGATLRAVLDAQGAMALDRFVPLLERICEVVHTAHEQGIVHRDLKPDNVMVISRAGRLLPKLLDFGIAQTVVDSEAPPAVASLRGSPPYMAPELWIAPHGAGRSVDQYALGALIYEALTGRVAAPGRTTLELARADARPERLPLGRELPPALEAVLDRAMARRAADRYANVLELAHAVRDASGVGRPALEIPHLDDDLRVQLLAHAPQPIADAVAGFDAAKNAHQAREALRALARVVGWYVALLALACRSRIGSGAAADSDATRALITDLRRHGLTPAGWIALARQLTRPFATAPDTYPIPELVLLLHPRSDSDVLAAILQGSLAESLADTSEDAAAQAIARELPQVTALLRASLFLLDYQVVVARGARGERWMGTRGARRSTPLARELPDGRAVLIGCDGVPLLVLWPLVQVATPVPGHGEQLFLLSGPGRRGARLVSAPHGFELHDAAVWEWFRAELLERGDDTAGVAAGNPYRGLAAYRRDDAGWFHGRERESEALVNRLKLEAFVAVVGPSGVGKSSFVHAGVAPALGWQVVGLRPGRSPLAQLAGQLAAAGVDAAGIAAGASEAGAGDAGAGDAGVAAVTDRLRRAAAAAGGLLIVVDQFEELLTLGCPAGERARFVRILLAVTSATDAPLRVVITLRDDFLIRIEQLPGLGPALARGIQLLGPLGPDALERIIVEPARRAGFELEDPTLPARMVAAVAGAPAAVALISFTASRLWELRDRHFHQLSARAYDAIGGVTGALARHADETIDAMPAAERRLARAAFRHLVTSEGTRAVLERDELHQLLGAGADTARLIERLVEARLLISSENDRRAGVIEIVHEALIRAWPRLVEWRRDDVEGSRFHEQLRSAARQWQDRGRPRGLLWRGDALAEYQLWRRRHAAALTPAEAAFGAASLADAARGRRIRRAIAAAAALATAIFVIALWRASLTANQSKRTAEDLLRDSYLEQGRLRVLDGDTLGARRPLAMAYLMGSTGPATRLLLEAALQPARARVHTLVGHSDKLWDVAYSPDGKWIAAASSDHTARVWDAATGELRATIAHAARVITVAFSSDSRLLASGGHDRVVRVWDVIANRQVTEIPVDVITRVAFGPDPSVLLTVSVAAAVRLWRVPGGAPIGELGGHGDLISATFCGDGSCIVTLDMAGLAIWDATTLARRASYAQPNMYAVAVSRTGELIAAGGGSGELVLLRGDATVIARRAAHGEAIFDVAISPDGSLIATGGNDSTARLWSAAGEPRGVLAGHRANITAVRFTRAGDRVVTASADSTARLWTASGMLLGELTGHTNIIMAAAIRSDGGRLATASWDHSVMVWDLAGAQELRALPVPRDRAPPLVVFNPAGRLLAVAHGDGALSIIDVRTAAVSCSAVGAPAIARLAWTDDDDLVTVRAGGRAVERWRARTCSRRDELVHAAPITALSAQPGPRVVTAAGGVVQVWRDGRVEAAATGYPGPIDRVGVDGDRVWAVTTAPARLVVDAIGGPPRRTVLADATKPITDVQLDPERGLVLAVSFDQFLYAWHAETGALVRRLESSGPLSALRISPDGALIVGLGGFAPTVWSRLTGIRRDHLDGHSAVIVDGGFIDDRIFVSLALNRIAFVWDLTTARALRTFRDVEAIAFAPDRRTVAMIGATGVRLWSPHMPVPGHDELLALQLE